MMDVKIDL